LGRLLTGSVAEEVLRNAPCPVLAVRTPLPQGPPAEAEAPARPGDIIDVRPLRAALASAKTKTLAKAGDLEVLRLIVPAGKLLEEKAKGETVVHCLEGRVGFTAFGKSRDLEAGELLYLPAGEPYRVRGIESASLLVTALWRQ
jgi:hypothetical protein